MQLHMSSQKSFLWFLGSLALTACSSSGSTAPTGDSVDAAYAALVGDVANCAKQVKSCVDAAADDAARATCREQLDGCRDDAGKEAMSAIAMAVRACTQQHNRCVKDAKGGAAASCKDELKTCLHAAHPTTGRGNDDDAGVDEHGKAADSSDCLDEMDSCVEADDSADTCAQNVRECVVDSLPSGDEVVPTTDGQDETDNSGSDHGDAGVASEHGKPADAGAKGKSMMNAARQCVDTFSSCVDSGSAARTCAKALKDCHSASK
jgi:hypothetical protein